MPGGGAKPGTGRFGYGYGLSGRTFSTSAGGGGVRKKIIDEDGEDLVFDFELKDKGDCRHHNAGTVVEARVKGGGGKVVTTVEGGGNDDLEGRGRVDDGQEGTFYMT